MSRSWRWMCTAAAGTSVVASLASTPASAQASSQQVPGWQGLWELDARTARVGEHMGKPAVFVRGQAPPILAAGVEFADGTIEFDMSALPNGNFVGLVFRYADGFNHENVYFRLHKSGEFEAVQYAPRINGSGGTWQLYPQFFGRATLPTNGWVHVRAEVRGSSMELFVGDSATPLIVVPRLRGLPRSGRVGIWGRVNDQPEQWTAAIANFRVIVRAPAAIASADTTSLPAGTVTGWHVAGPYAAPDSSKLPPFPAQSEWKPISVEEDGLVNITKLLRKPGAGRFAAFLRTTVESPAPRVASLDFAFSDDAVVWLNGAPVYEGFNALGSRYPGYLGLATLGAQRLYLPLRAGTNELLVVLSDRVAGWGIKARLVDAHGRVQR
jgi:hypothetical protein